MESSYDDMVLFQQSSVSLDQRILLACQRNIDGKPVDALRQLQVDGHSDEDIVRTWIELQKKGQIPEAHVTFGFIQQIAGDFKKKVLQEISDVVNEGL